MRGNVCTPNEATAFGGGVIAMAQWKIAAKKAPLLTSKYNSTGMISSTPRIIVGAAHVSNSMASGCCANRLAGRFRSTSCTKYTGAHEYLGVMNPSLNFQNPAAKYAQRNCTRTVADAFVVSATDS